MTTELRKRVITGVIGVTGLILLIVFGGFFGTALLAAVVALAMMFEFTDMVLTLSDRPEKRWVLIGTTWLISFFNAFMVRSEHEMLVICLLGLFAYFLFTAERHQGPELSIHFRELMYSLFGLLYLAFLPLYLPLIRDSARGVHWVLIFLFINWAGDTAAYFAGSKYGRHKLYPLISPKKTVEGAFGGLLGSVAVTLLYKVIVFRALSWGAVFVIPLLVGTVAQIGDLCESFLKRAFDRKDSGEILPGHGGFLDRFDGVVFSLPVMYACVRLFGG